MGLLNRLFGQSAKPTKVDPVFGSIKYDQQLWTNIPDFSKDKFMIVIDAPEQGPSHAQREYFASIVERMTDIVIQAKQYIKSIDPNVQVEELSVYSIVIGTDDSIKEQAFVLELSDHEAEEIHRVEFSNGEPQAYGVDC